MDINDKVGRTSKQKHSKVPHHINEYSICINKYKMKFSGAAYAKKFYLKNKRNVTTIIYKEKRKRNQMILSGRPYDKIQHNTNVCMNDIDITNQS